jgi:hypothetical protein
MIYAYRAGQDRRARERDMTRSGTYDVNSAGRRRATRMAKLNDTEL